MELRKKVTPQHTAIISDTAMKGLVSKAQMKAIEIHRT